MRDLLKKTIFLHIAEFCFNISDKHINKRNRHHYKAKKYFERGNRYLTKGK